MPILSCFFTFLFLRIYDSYKGVEILRDFQPNLTLDSNGSY